LFELFRREWQLARERAEAAMTLATEHGFPYWLAFGTVMRGGALAEQGQVEEGIAQMQQGLAAFRAMGTEAGRPHRLALLAEAYGRVGQIEEGLIVLAKALAMGDKNGERNSEAELYRLKGELTLKTVRNPGSGVRSPKGGGGVSSQGHCHCHRQSAKAWELRAVMSLSRLWQRQGKKDEARQMLAEIYNSFTEGFDTADLKDAKALLEELS
jgi:predicted ATPase